MTMAVRTGATEHRRCDLCGLMVEHYEWSPLSGPGPLPRYWSARNHLAPCGLQCMRGGARGIKISELRAAGKTLRDVTHGKHCSACEAMTLEQSLEALERADPEVKAAAEQLERVTRQIGNAP